MPAAILVPADLESIQPHSQLGDIVDASFFLLFLRQKATQNILTIPHEILFLESIFMTKSVYFIDRKHRKM